MATFLLIIIYISFISLGLPDSILGSAWPQIHSSIGVSLSLAGVLSMIVSSGTIISSLFSEKLIRRFGTGKVTAISVFMTAVALFGYYLSPHFVWLCIFAIPLGLGAGSVDSALNNFVALHYEAKHMSWLHCFWGIGATAGPIIMSLYLGKSKGWRNGYLTIAIIQFCLVVVLFAALPLWKTFQQKHEEASEAAQSISIISLLKIKGAKPTLTAFFCYCAVESTCGLWGSSYFVQYKNISIENAAKWISFFYFGITLGRLLSGFLTYKLSSKNIIRSGQITCFTGTVVLLLPFATYFQLCGIILIGLGCAPIFPSMLHETPNRFGKELSQAIMGIQMACAYIGATVMPPLFGLLAEKINIQLYPYYLMILVVIMIVFSEMAPKRPSI